MKYVNQYFFKNMKFSEIKLIYYSSLSLKQDFPDGFMNINYVIENKMVL